jgi:ammonium transporter, Amt family
MLDYPKKNNRISAFVQLFSIVCLVSLLWITIGYSIAFGDGNSFVGNGNRIWLQGSLLRTGNQSQGQVTSLTKHRLNCNVPETVLIVFQGAFAAIAAAIIYGAWAERMKFHGALIFTGCWHLLVYSFVARWHWSDQGWLYMLGALDYAGGDVVHVSAGFSGLAAALYFKPRLSIQQGRETQYSSMSNTLIGTCLLWVGWFGFNGGSAGSANGRAGYAFITTQVCAAASSLIWTVLDFIVNRHYSPISIASGAIVGLVIITPGCGYVDLTGAFLMALLGSPVCYFAMYYKNPLRLDDAMDSFAIHGVGGVLGSLLTGLFSNSDVTGDGRARGAFRGHWVQLAYQLCGVCAVAAWSLLMTLLILYIVDQGLIHLLGKEYSLAAGSQEDLDWYQHDQPRQEQPQDYESDAKQHQQQLADVVVFTNEATLGPGPASSSRLGPGPNAAASV